MRVIFWGAGRYAERFLNKIRTDDRYQDNYVAIVDNNIKRRGQDFYGLKVIVPKDLKNLEYDIVVITTIYEADIHNQMVETLGIPEEKIFSVNNYEALCVAAGRYKSRYYTDNIYKREAAFDLSRIVVYTAIIGEYDTLKEPSVQDEGIDYICFTDNLALKSKIWNIQRIRKQDMDDIHAARHFKTNPHTYFQEYSTSIWVDGKFQIKGNLRDYIVQYQRESKMICFPHFERNCIVNEAAECITLGKGNKRDMLIQVSDYLKSGYPIDNGLYDTGCIVRAHNDMFIRELMMEWEKEINKYSIRDQLSFPYVCWKKGIEPDICNLLIYKNPWLLGYDHLK